MWVIAIFFAFALGQSTLAQKKTIAVLEFQTSGSIDRNEATTLTNRFRGILVKNSLFNIVEREKMQDILKAQDFNLTDNCNTAECAVQVGQLLGVEAMIAGDIGRVGKAYTIDLRYVDVESGKISQTIQRNYRGDVEGLLDEIEKIAQVFPKIAKQAASVAFSTSATPSFSWKPSTKLLWYVGGAALVGGTAAVLLSGDKKSSGSSAIKFPELPND